MKTGGRFVHLQHHTVSVEKVANSPQMSACLGLCYLGFTRLASREALWTLHYNGSALSQIIGPVIGAVWAEKWHKSPEDKKREP